MEKLKNILVWVLLISFICLPSVAMLKVFKVFIIILLLIIAYIKKVKLYIEVVILFVIFESYSLFSTIYGIFSSNPGAIRSSTVFLLWPLLFTSIIGLLKKQDIFKIDKLLIKAYKIILIICTIQIIESITKKSDMISNLFDGNTSSYINLKSAYVLFSNPALSSLIFLLPYFITQSILLKKNKYIIYSIIGLIIPLLTGRRALALIILSSIFIFVFLITILVKKIDKLLFNRIYKKISRIFFVLVIAIFTAILVYREQILNIFIKNKIKSNDARTDQLISLIEGFISSPFIGHGNGAVASVVRSDSMPWSYELFYLSILFHQGIIGFLLYLFAFVWIVLNLIKIFKNNQNESGSHVLSICIAFICFIIASFTNPYIAKLDYMWVLFYPIALINTFNRK